MLSAAAGLFLPLLIVSGCVSATQQAAEVQTVAPVAAEEVVAVDPAAAPPQEGYSDPLVAAAGDAATMPASATALSADASQAYTTPAGVVLQPTGLSAASTSIYSNQVTGTVPQGATAGSVNPIRKSLYGNNPVPAVPAGSLLEGADAMPEAPAATQTAEAAATLVPLPDSGTAEPAATTEIAAADPQTFDAKRFNKPTIGRTPVSTQQAEVQLASLAFAPLPSAVTNPALSMDDDYDISPEVDDQPQVELASLPSLARLSPNGLWLQTEKVDTGCFKPELMTVLKTIEGHYGKKVMVTSGRRGAKMKRLVSNRRQSLHVTCEAADIQIPGVNKWDLAAYLRTMPGRGGVGTYCHTESVHIDIGQERDWNWRCRKRRS